MNIEELHDHVISINTPFSEEQLNELDKYYNKIIGHIIHGTVIKDDITHICVDAIVNPANIQGLGCFQKDHKCLDNIIHRRAGPRLRDECRKILKGNLLSTPSVMVTNAYNLPCKCIMHVAGPDFNADGILKYDLLLKCYKNCIDLAIKLNLKTIAFPCISTGMFGYPIEQTARMVLANVKSTDIKIIFVCYDDKNYMAYKDAT